MPLSNEPTNHLDVDGILWLEELLRDEASAYLVVSHDRYFLERVAGRVLELHRAYPDGVFESPGPYSEFLVRRETFLQSQAAYEQVLANKVRQEVAWLRRGPKARTRKGAARVAAAGRLIHELDEVRGRMAEASIGIELNASERRSKKLLVATDHCKQVGERRLFYGLDVTLGPGVRLGLVGPSGSGKSTDPAFDSLMASAPTCSPENSLGRYVCFCASVPFLRIWFTQRFEWAPKRGRSSPKLDSVPRSPRRAPGNRDRLRRIPARR